jgi:outer membrane protein
VIGPLSKTLRAGLLALGAASSLAAAARAEPGRLLTLAEAEKTAREAPPVLRQARAATAAARARAGTAGAAYLPQLSATAGYSRSTGNLIPQPVAGLGSAGTSFDNSNKWAASLGASQLIYDFGQTGGRIGAAEALADSAAAAEKSTALLSLLSVRQAFFSARAAMALLGVAREAYGNLKKHREQVESFVAAGTRPRIDLAQAKADEANALFAQVSSENGYETARQVLNIAMGLEASTQYDVADEGLPAVQGEEQPLDGLLQEALGARPEVATLEGQAKAQRETLRSISGQYAPVVAATALANGGGVAVDNLGFNVSVGVGLTWNLNFYPGSATRAQIAEAEANLQQLAAQADGLRQQIRGEVDLARLAVRAGASQKTSAAEARSNARDRLRLAEERYQQGVGNAIELGDAQLAVTQAEAQAVQAEQSLAQARALLLKALGRP